MASHLARFEGRAVSVLGVASDGAARLLMVGSLDDEIAGVRDCVIGPA